MWLCMQVCALPVVFYPPCKLSQARQKEVKVGILETSEDDKKKVREREASYAFHLYTFT